jgi:hypothetical protein
VTSAVCFEASARKSGASPVAVALLLIFTAQVLNDVEWTPVLRASLRVRHLPDRLEKDVALMQKSGITVVRLGESTWTSWEPREGEFEFAWMQRILDCLHGAGIRVILGTPTYSIPPWLYRKHPEIW